MEPYKFAEDEFGRRQREDESTDFHNDEHHPSEQQRWSSRENKRGRWGTIPNEGPGSTRRQPGVENHQDPNTLTPHEFESTVPTTVNTLLVPDSSDNRSTMTLNQWKDLPWLERLKSQVRR